MKATEKQKAQMKQYYQENKERILTRQGQYYKQNRELILAQQKRNPTHTKAVKREYFRRTEEKWRNYRLQNRDRLREKANRFNHQLKLEVLTHYGGEPPCCQICGFEDIRALSIDHIEGDGREHRKKIGSGLRAWLKRNHYPEGYQVLCMNCQFIKRFERGENRWGTKGVL